MRPRLLGAREVVVIAPHPDDETIGAFGLMRALRARGARVRVIVVSDGAASHPGSAAWPPARLVPERRRETGRAMAALGLPRSRLRFLGLPDGGLERAGARLGSTLARALRRGRRPDLIVGPAPDDDHPDHRAVARSLARAARGVRRIGYRVWPLDRAGGGSVAIPLAPATLRAKRRVVRGYRTQTGRITDATGGCLLTWRHVARFVRPLERFAVLG